MKNLQDQKTSKGKLYLIQNYGAYVLCPVLNAKRRHTKQHLGLSRFKSFANERTNILVFTPMTFRRRGMKKEVAELIENCIVKPTKPDFI